MDSILVNILYAFLLIMVIGTIIETSIVFIIEPIIRHIKFKRKFKQGQDK